MGIPARCRIVRKGSLRARMVVAHQSVALAERALPDPGRVGHRLMLGSLCDVVRAAGDPG